MGLLDWIIGKRPYPSAQGPEVKRLLDELFKIGRQDDFLSERPGGAFNAQCRHIRAREIGQRMNEIGGMTLMEYAHNRIRRKLGKEIGAHLEYAWAEIGRWMP